jgi:hypothetical protein
MPERSSESQPTSILNDFQGNPGKGKIFSIEIESFEPVASNRQATNSF